MTACISCQAETEGRVTIVGALESVCSVCAPPNEDPLPVVQVAAAGPSSSDDRQDDGQAGDAGSSPAGETTPRDEATEVGQDEPAVAAVEMDCPIPIPDTAHFPTDPPAGPAPDRFALRVGEEWVARFTSPPQQGGMDSKDWKKVLAAWEKSPGVRVAGALKAHLGPTPFTWDRRDSANCVAAAILGASLWEGSSAEYPWIGEHESARERVTEDAPAEPEPAIAKFEPAPPSSGRPSTRRIPATSSSCRGALVLRVHLVPEEDGRVRLARDADRREEASGVLPRVRRQAHRHDD